jgi:hypothetical protein
MNCRTRAILVLVVLSLLGQVAAWAAAPAAGGPFNPAALMQQSLGRTTGDRFTFALFGDSYDRPPLVSLMRMVDARAPAFVVTLGDMIEGGKKEEVPKQWQEAGEHTGWFLRAYASWPVIGNHEVDADYDFGLRSFLGFYGLKDQNYSFTFRNCKFIILGHDPECRPDPPDQVAFVRRELADRDRYDHVFVFRHVPFYTVGMKEADQVPNAPTALTKLFDEGRVTAAFAGHDHHYYRTRRENVNYLIAGVAGAGVYNLVRLSEQAPGDAYLGVSKAEDQVILHVPGRVDRFVPFQGYYETGDELLFAVFVHVNGKSVTAEAVSLSGEVWDSFPLAGEGFGVVGTAAPAGASTTDQHQ